MPLTILPQEKKQQKLLLILAGVVLVTFIVLYFSFFRPAVPSGQELPGDGQENVPVGGINDVDFMFLQDSRFNELKKYGQWPIKPGQTGRENPFLPLNQGIEAGGEINEEALRNLSVEEFIEVLSNEELEGYATSSEAEGLEE